MKAVTVLSTKGGVGKTLVAINLARRMHEKGYKVGLFDADFDSSNFSEFTGEHEELDVKRDDSIILHNWDGIKVYSTSLFSKDKAVSMDSSRYTQMIADIINYGNWDDIEYIIIDCPAGSSTIFKSLIILFSKMLLGSVVVVHPSSHEDAIRAVKLHQFNDIKILGLIENMAYARTPTKCPKCDHKFDATAELFKPPFGKDLCKEQKIDYFGQIPLAKYITDGLKEGKPYLHGHDKIPITNAMKKIEKSKVYKPGFLHKVKITIGEKMIQVAHRIVADLIVISNKNIDISDLKNKAGFLDEYPFDMVITDNEKTKELVRAHLRVRDKVYHINDPNIKPKYEVVFDLPTLSRLIVGERTLTSGNVIKYDHKDAWLNGDVSIYGEGHFPKAIKTLRYIFSDQDVINKLNEKYGKQLRRFI